MIVIPRREVEKGRDNFGTLYLRAGVGGDRSELMNGDFARGYAAGRIVRSSRRSLEGS